MPGERNMRDSRNVKKKKKSLPHPIITERKRERENQRGRGKEREGGRQAGRGRIPEINLALTTGRELTLSEAGSSTFQCST